MSGHRPFNEIKRGDDSDPAYRAKVDAHKAAIRAEEDEMAMAHDWAISSHAAETRRDGPSLVDPFIERSTIVAVCKRCGSVRMITVPSLGETAIGLSGACSDGVV